MSTEMFKHGSLSPLVDTGIWWVGRTHHKDILVEMSCLFLIRVLQREGFAVPMFSVTLVILTHPCWLPCQIRRCRKVEIYTRKRVAEKLNGTLSLQMTILHGYTCTEVTISALTRLWRDSAARWDVFSSHRREFKDADIPCHSFPSL